MKTVICAIAKNENRYIREWVEYYNKLGATKIVLYDNNDKDGERFDAVLEPYIKNGFVEVVDYRGKHKSFSKKYAEESKNHGVQQDAYEDCYKRYSKDFDWFGFFDIDEFLYICDGKSLNSFLSSDKFKNTDVIQFNWKCFGDNDLLKYEDKPVRERFKTKSRLQSEHVKSMVRGGFTNISLPCHIAIVKNGRYSYPNGKKTKCNFKQPISLECAYVEHYLTKTIDEWCDRKFGTTSATGKDYFNDIDSRIKIFFAHNKMTPEKKKIVEEKKKNIEKKKNYVIVSLTSYKERIDSLPKVFDALLGQTKKPGKIVLTIFKDDKKYLTSKVQKYIDSKKVELILADDNLRPHLKYFYVMKKYKNYPIVTVDDDIIYPSDMIESLFKSYEKNKTVVSARRVHKITRDSKNNILPYNKWVHECKNVLTPSNELFATGVGGVLYPPDILKISDENKKEIPEVITADDVYLKYLEEKLNVKVLWVKNKTLIGKEIKTGDVQKKALNKTNVIGKKNDEYIKKFLVDKLLLKEKEKKAMLAKKMAERMENAFSRIFYLYSSQKDIKNFNILKEKLTKENKYQPSDVFKKIYNAPQDDVKRYEILKEAKSLGYKNILLIEEPAIFNKNEEAIKKLFSNIPDDADIVLFDKMVPANTVEILRYKNYVKKLSSDGTMFGKKKDVNVPFLGSSCFYLSEKAINKLLEQQKEKILKKSDILNNASLNIYFSVENAAITDGHDKDYERIGIDIWKYKDKPQTPIQNKPSDKKPDINNATKPIRQNRFLAAKKTPVYGVEKKIQTTYKENDANTSKLARLRKKISTSNYNRLYDVL